ncbi:hypothetical protein [Paenibacillus silvisoli]|uniref:hypothetical protein n=1 Tax=Paenibacillus silvisoli TaxID=3110539 RepID=UPI0028064925|nr:hypothetical protein [Paenibacillus silvisoli]
MGRRKACKCQKTVNYYYNITIHNDYRRFTWIQKAQSGGQINKDVGFNANQGGQIAVRRSKNIQKGERPAGAAGSVLLSRAVRK